MKTRNTRITSFFLLLILLFIPLIVNISPKKNTVLGNTSLLPLDVDEDSYLIGFPGLGSVKNLESNDGLDYYIWFLSLDFTAPVITDVNHSPLNPKESEMISVGANVTDASGIYNVTLHYCVNRGLWINIEMTVSFAFPDIYIADIDTFAAGDLIKYYITAFDASGNWNEGINDNGGLFYSFTILPAIPEFNINPILMIMTTLGLVSLVYLATKKEK